VAVGGDGQVSIGQTIVKANAKKVRRLGKGDVIGGFAGRQRMHSRCLSGLNPSLSNIRPAHPRRGRACQGLAHRSLPASARSDDDRSRQGCVAGAYRYRRRARTGSRNRRHRFRRNYALAAARALADGVLDAEAIVRKSLDIAADICVYTNRNVTIETLKT